MELTTSSLTSAFFVTVEATEITNLQHDYNLGKTVYTLDSKFKPVTLFACHRRSFTTSPGEVALYPRALDAVRRINSTSWADHGEIHLANNPRLEPDNRLRHTHGHPGTYEWEWFKKGPDDVHWWIKSGTIPVVHALQKLGGVPIPASKGLKIVP